MAEKAQSKKRKVRHELPGDVAVVGGPTEDGQGRHLLRVKQGNVSVGEMRPAAEGKPIGDGELVRLKPLEAAPHLHEVEVLHPGRQSERKGRSGPAPVSNEAYRKGWSTIFGAGRPGKRRYDIN